jgi:exopolysaccharide production protein ExoY
VASKTVSELSKLSANLTVFDLPVHEGGQVTSSLEPMHTRERARKQPPSKSKPTRPARPPAKREVLAPELGLSALIRAAGAIDGPVPDACLLAKPQAATPQPVGGAAKRTLDILIAGTTIVALAPLLLAVALAIYATMGRPILFPQRRLGFEGRPFPCLKFRTMVKDADSALKSHLANNPEAAREWTATQKLRHDPRVTALGRALRRSSIDELPQLFSVLRGHMSCVGPRPIIDEEVARYGRHWADYIRARPGLTGPWQVSGRNRLSYRTRVALDTRYVRAWSLWRDLWILVRTIPAVLKTDDTA